MTKPKFFLALIISLFAVSLFSQDLPSDEVEVIKSFDARLLDTEKIKVHPELPNLDTASHKLNYDIPDKTINVDYLPPKLRPIAMKAEKLPPSYKGFVKAGAGIPNALYGEFGYNNLGDNFHLDIGLKHRSANFKDTPHKRFMENNANIKGTYYLNEGVAINGDIGFSNDEVHFFAFPPEDTTLLREDVRQRFNTFTFGGMIYNGEKTQGDINYHAGFDFYRLSDNYATDENGFDLQIGGTKWIDEKHPLTINLQTDFTSLKDTADQELNNFFLQPSFTYHADAFKVKIGANLASHEDVFSFFPNIEALANIVGNKFTVFAGWEGGLVKNNFKALSDYNPFIQSRIRIENNKYNNIYGGIKGNVNFLEYQGKISLKRNDKLALFLNDSINIKRFNVLYDKVNIINISGSLHADVSDQLDVGLTLSQNIFDMDIQEKAWHLPSLEANLTAYYTSLNEKFRLKANWYIADGVPFQNEEGITDDLNALFDISLGAEYQLTKNIGIFMDLNNLFSNKRERWYGYETYGLNVLGGVSAKF